LNRTFLRDLGPDLCEGWVLGRTWAALEDITS